MQRKQKVDRSFIGYSQDKKVAFYQNVLDEMIPVTTPFQKPPVAYTIVQTQLDKVKSTIKLALTKATGTATAVGDAFAIEDVSFEALDDYVDSVAQGNSIIIISSGYLATSDTANAAVVTGMPVISHEFIQAAGEAAFDVVSLGSEVTYNFIISTDLTGLKKVGNFYSNPTVGAQTFFGSSKQKHVIVTGLPSKVDLFIVCYATNTAGNSLLSNVLPFICK